MFEHRQQPLLSRSAFLLRLARTGGIAAAIIFGSLAVGTVGYHCIEGLGWIDAELNAAMLLSGMGPVNAPQKTGGKLFASAYALFSGIVFLTVAAVLFAPALHRLIHRFHMEIETDQREDADPAGPRLNKT